MKYQRPEITFCELELTVKSMASKYGSCDGQTPLCYKELFK